MSPPLKLMKIKLNLYFMILHFDAQWSWSGSWVTQDKTLHRFYLWFFCGLIEPPEKDLKLINLIIGPLGFRIGLGLKHPKSNKRLTNEIYDKNNMNEERRPIKCKKSLYKSTYQGHAFTEGECYDCVEQDQNFFYFLDNEGNQFSMQKYPSHTHYYVHDYFELELTNEQQTSN